MKMNYRLQNNRNNRSPWKMVWVTFLILAVAGLFYFIMPRFINESLYLVARPFWNTEEFVVKNFSEFVTLFKDKESLAAENISLQEQIDEARASILTLESYKKENEDLKMALGRQSKEKRILAVILAKPNKSIYDSLILDTGEHEGVTAGDIVMSGDFILGTIKEVYPNYSKATLFSSPGEPINVRIGNGISASAVGNGGGNFIVKLPKETPIKIGDSVTLPDINLKLFGLVENIEVTETSSFQFILFKLPVNVNSLNYVEILKKQS